MTLAWLLLLTGLLISAVAIYYSVIGLAAIFAAAVVPIYIMGGSLEVAKLVCASWLKANWDRAPRFMKYYMITAVAVLMLITSMGIFGFLSKAHTDQSIVSGDVQSKIAIYDEKIKVAKENIDANRKALRQMDEAVDQVMGRSQDEKGADKAVALRRGQAKERTRLLSEIAAEQKVIAQLSEERAPIAAEVRKVEAEVGPIKYIAKLIYGDNPDANILEKAVTWVIILIVIVFDPLAVIMLLAAQMTFQWHRAQKEQEQYPTIADLDHEVGEKPTAEELKDDLFPTYEEITPANEPVINEKTHPYLYTGDFWKKPEGWVDVGPLVAKAEPSLEKEKDLNIIEEVGIEQWNKMLEEAEKAVQEERENFEKGNIEALPEETVEKFEEEILVEEGSEFPSDPFKGQKFRLRLSQEDIRNFIFNGEQWIDADHSDQEVVKSLEEESKKKSRYMTKDRSGKIQIKDRL